MLHCLPQSTAFPNFSDPGWLGSEETLPEFISSLPFPNALTRAPYFDNFLIMNDPLHVIFRGIAPSFVSSTIALAARTGHWGAGDIQSRFDVGFAAAREFARRKGYDAISLDEFSKSTLGLEDPYPEINCKGADVKTLIFWLAFLLQQKLQFAFMFDIFAFMIHFQSVCSGLCYQVSSTATASRGTVQSLRFAATLQFRCECFNLFLFAIG